MPPCLAASRLFVAFAHSNRWRGGCCLIPFLSSLFLWRCLCRRLSFLLAASFSFATAVARKLVSRARYVFLAGLFLRGVTGLY